MVYSYVTEGSGTSLSHKLCELTVPLATELMTLLIGGYQTSFLSGLLSSVKREEQKAKYNFTEKKNSKSELLLFPCVCGL